MQITLRGVKILMDSLVSPIEAGARLVDLVGVPATKHAKAVKSQRKHVKLFKRGEIGA